MNQFTPEQLGLHSRMSKFIQDRIEDGMDFDWIMMTARRRFGDQEYLNMIDKVRQTTKVPFPLDTINIQYGYNPDTKKWDDLYYKYADGVWLPEWTAKYIVSDIIPQSGLDTAKWTVDELREYWYRVWEIIDSAIEPVGEEGDTNEGNDTDQTWVGAK